jgi:two-component system chemotaxis response regulator CheY
MSSKPWVGKSVVIIDDSANVREELRRGFEGCGLTVKGLAENGVVGLALVEKVRPEVVSLDLIMPEMDGVECYRKIMALGFDLKVMMVSWLGAETKIMENLKDLIPAHHFQKKPATVSDLEVRLQRIYFPEKEVKAPIKALDDTSPDFLGDLGIKVS